MIRSKLFSKTAEVRRSNLRLVLEYVVAEFVADFPGSFIEIAGDDGSVQRPAVEWKRKVVTDNGDIVGFAGLFQKRRGTAAVGTLQIFKNYDRDLSSLGRLEDRICGLG